MEAGHKQTGKNSESVFSATVIIGALGYFVDIYDLLLFGIVRIPSLKAIGVDDSMLLDVGVFLINMQMAGMLIGGILWGIIGDKRGRVSVLFGSILLYSLANILNAFITTINVYGILRFLAGIGLAGELGAAITLVSETLSKERRGVGTAIVASIGILGAVVAGIVGDFFNWKVAYLIGGTMGVVLLGLRVSIFESGMFHSIRNQNISRGDLRLLLTSPKNFLKYMYCVLVGVPVWFVVGILITFSPELAKQLSVKGEIIAGRAILFCYLGLSIGDLVSGILSQILKSRRLVVLGFLGLTFILMTIYLYTEAKNNIIFYALCSALGFGTGYWAVFMTIAAEQFGTNIRSTVTTTVPNFVRGSVVLLTSMFQLLQGRLGLITSAWVIGFSTLVLAAISLWKMPETFGKELNYIEPEL